MRNRPLFTAAQTATPTAAQTAAATAIRAAAPAALPRPRTAVGPLAAVCAVACAALTLSGCGVLGKKNADAQAADATPTSSASQGALAFDVQVNSSDRAIAKHLERHLSLQRYTRFPDLRQTEFNRLLAEARTNASDLLAALGYFNPELQLRVQEGDTLEEGETELAPRTIVIDVEPGPQATIASHAIAFEGDAADNPAAQRQRARIERRWPLKEGSAFTQTEWDSAKQGGLRELQKLRYPTAQISDSQARVDADANRVDLRVRYDSGPAYRFGALQLQGLERYDAEGISHIARIPTGADYSEEALLDAQQRLASSGYFESAFLMIDTDSEPDNATVIAQLREAPYQKLVFGVGLSTDAGARLSLDHVHNQLWPLGWRAVSQVALDMRAQKASTRWSALPQRNGWAWYLGGSLSREDVGDYKTNTLSLTGGRSKTVGHIERRYYLQYDMSQVTGNGLGSSSALLGSYSWTGRYFNNKTNPTAGFGLGAELGAGYTLTPERKPFARTRLRAQGFWPLGQRNEAGRRSRLALRGELGAVVANSATRVPASLLFLTGGDATVRGYSYHSIGTRAASGKLYGGRYMGVASLEWQRPLTLMGNVHDWESAVFLDTGAVANNTGHLKLHTGLGAGLRWNSPVGPMQADLAYGIQEKQVRLHLRMGFTF